MTGRITRVIQLLFLLLAIGGCGKVAFTTPPAPSPPVVAEPYKPLASWDSVENATGYKVYYGEVPDQYTTHVDVGDHTEYRVDGLTPERTYYFAVTAYNTVGESPYSVEVKFVMPKLGDTPTEVLSVK